MMHYRINLLRSEIISKLIKLRVSLQTLKPQRQIQNPVKYLKAIFEIFDI